MAEPGRSSLRLGLLILLAVVALLDVLTLLQGARSVRRLTTRAEREVRERVLGARPDLERALQDVRGPAGEAAAARALELALAAEVELLDGEGRTLLSRPTIAPVAHLLTGDERTRLARGDIVTLTARSGRDVRVLSYLPVSANPPRTLRLATPVADLGEALAEWHQGLFAHLASLGGLLLAAVLALGARERGERGPASALGAYEEAVERLRARGQALTERHEEERRRLENAVRERETMARAGELTAGIVHEVRNGLGTVVGYARLLERGAGAEPARQAARAILEECDTLEVVVRRFMDFVREESLHLAPIDLGRLLERVSARELRGRETVTPALALPAEPILIRGDETLLERAFENLVRNAVDAAQEGGAQVTVRLAWDGPFAVVSVADDGPGLPPGKREIRPFSSSKPGGLGLGLPMAAKLVRLHGGSLTLEDASPSGLEVVVRLPRDGPAIP